MFKDLHISYRISLGQLCDDGCNTILDKKRINVVKGNPLVLSGKINQMGGFWDIPLTAPVSLLSTFQ